MELWYIVATGIQYGGLVKNDGTPTVCFHQNVANEIHRLGGKASPGSDILNRPNFSEVKKALENGTPLQINCD